MKRIDNWQGQIEDTAMEYDSEEVKASASYSSSTTKAVYVCEYDAADKTDYIIAAASGIPTGIIDSLWVGEFSLSEAQDWGRSKTNSFVIKVAQIRGYGKNDLEGAIRHLEIMAPIPSDQLTSIWGGGLQHHFRDFAHHASIVGLIFSILTQFTGLSYGTNTEGLFEIHELPNKALIGTNFEEKIYNATVIWMLHLVSDMAGSSNNAGKGTGIPGPILSFAKAISVLPGIRNLHFNYKEDDITLSTMLSKIFNGTAFEHTSNKDLKRFDLRTELGTYAYSAKQSIPVIINQCIIRAYYFVRRLCVEFNNKGITKLADIARLNPSHFLPRNNKCIRRMATISSGVFCAIDTSDAAIRAFLSGAESKTAFATNFLLRTNFGGIGSFLISIKNDVAATFFGDQITSEKPVSMTDDVISLDNIIIDVSVDVDNTGIYEYSFYRMIKHVKQTKDKFTEAMTVAINMQRSILKLEDDETRLFDTVANASYHSLIVETEELMMRLLTFYGIGYVPFTGDEKYSFFAPFYRMEEGKKIAYVFAKSITDTLEQRIIETIEEKYNVDGIKVVALVELGEDFDTRDSYKEKEGFVKYITLQDLFLLISDNEYQTYKSYVDRYNEEIKKLIGYRTIMIPSESSLDQMKIDLEVELRNTDFTSLLHRDGVHNSQIQIIERNFWDRELYKAMIGGSAFAESFISSEWYYQTHIASTALEQTAIVAGYLKSVEQLLYTLVRFSIGTGKTIKKKSGGKTEYIEYNEENLDAVDTSLGSIIGYVRHYYELWDVNSYVKNYVADKLNVYRDKYRNDYFHKDNITSNDEIDDIRNNTILIHFLLLGSMKISDSQKELIGIEQRPIIEDVQNGLRYEDLSQWLDRILGGDVLLSPESNIYFVISAWGSDQWELGFSTVSGFTEEGFPQDMEWPYIGDELKWDRGEEDKNKAEEQTIELVRRYLNKGKLLGNLKTYKSVNVGWFGRHTILYPTYRD